MSDIITIDPNKKLERLLEFLVSPDIIPAIAREKLRTIEIDISSKNLLFF